jgi:lipopolysaccharide biosynthesis regulator YciM
MKWSVPDEQILQEVNFRLGKVYRQNGNIELAVKVDDYFILKP